MSCFWDALYKTGIFNTKDVKSSRDIISFLKSKNIESNIIVNGVAITQKLIQENYKAIHELSIDFYYHGYFTSMCDPVLCLVCNLFNIHIIHKWRLDREYTIIYSPINNITKPKIIISLFSDKGHAWN